MDGVAAIRRLPMTILAVLLVAGCAADPSASSTATAWSTVAPSESPSGAPTPSPEPTPMETSTPTSTPTAVPTAPAKTPAPIAAPWREVPSQASVKGVQFQDVVWAGTRFVAVAVSNDKAPGRSLDSLDGVTWHRQTSGAATGHPMRLAAGQGGVVAVGTIGDQPASWFSSDGLTWTAHPKAFPIPALGTDTVEITDIVARGNGWLAVGRRDPQCFIGCGLEPKRAYVWSSADGKNWTRNPDQAALKDGGMDAVAHGEGGLVAAGTSKQAAAIWTSPDGLIWSRVPEAAMFKGPSTPDGPSPVHTMSVAARDGIIVVMGNLGYGETPAVRAWWSADGKAWAKAPVEKAAEGQVFSVAATPDRFLATGPSGEPSCRGGIWASNDGRAWRCEASGAQFKGFGPYAAAASDSVEVAVGLDGGVDSPDGAPGAAWSRMVP